MKIIICIIFSIFSLSAKASPGDRQAYVGLTATTGANSMGFGIDFGTLWNQDFGWTFSIKIKPAGIKPSGVSYQTAKNVFGDSEGNAKYELTSFSVGRSYGFNDNFFISGAIGYQSYKKYVEFYDQTGILDASGRYHVLKDSSTVIILEASATYSFPGNPAYLNFGVSNSISNIFFGIGLTY